MQPQLKWDLGTAYDLFISLDVLHDPTTYGVRGVWAAGMRSRLPGAEREFLDEVMSMMSLPLAWVYTLPPPKDAATALRALEKVPPAERLLTLARHSRIPAEALPLLREIAAQGVWKAEERETLRRMLAAAERVRTAQRPGALDKLLKWCTRAEEFGERYLRALRAYYEAFFAEEERRIYPALQDALERGQELATRLSVPRLVEELSQGLSFTEVLKLSDLVLAPSYWSAPLIFFERLGEGRALLLFGGRPADAALVPGEVVPEQLLRALKALSDPTRLKIMRYLAREALTPTQLAHRLRLRAPTVVHHLQALRAAGLVQVIITEGKERTYAVRAGSVRTTCEGLQDFLQGEE